MRNRIEGGEQADARRRAEPEHPDKAHAGHVEQRTPDQSDEHGLAEAGWITSKLTTTASRTSATVFAGMSGRLLDSAEQPRDQNHECRLEEFPRLNVDAEDHQPAPRALDLGAEIGRRGNQDQADDENDQRQLADPARRQKGRREEHRGGGNEEKYLVVDEMERVEADARGDRRARRQTKDDAAQHQGAERRQRQPVDCPPPFA